MPIALLCAFLAVASVQMFVPPFVGLANNNDFGRVLLRFSFTPVNGWGDNFIYFVADYHKDPRAYWNPGVPTSEALLFAPVAWLSEHYAGGFLDIRWHGLLHLALFAVGFALFLYAMRTERPVVTLVTGLAAVWILGDIRYIAALNSFYTDTAAFLGLFIALPSLAVLFREGKSWSAFTAAAGAALLAGAKTQHAPLGLLVAAVLLTLAYRRASRSCLLAGLALFLVSTAMFRMTPRIYNAPPVFNAIFYRILPGSPSLQADAAELAIRPEELRYVGMHAYMPGNPCERESYQQEFATRVTPGRLALFYLRHPWRTAQWLYLNLVGETPFLRSLNLANYQRKDGVPPGTLSHRFDSWTELRSWLSLHWPSHLIVFYLGALAFGLTRWRAGFLLLAAAGLYSFASAALFDATETNRHLGIFHAETDALVLLTVATIARWAGRFATQPQPE